MSGALLEVSDLHGWYGESHVLHGVDFDVEEGEVVTLLGRNGAGRTSTMRAIMGLIGARKGSIKVRGVETIALPTHRIARLGLGYCPEERGIFSSLSAEENLMLPPTLAPGGMSIEQIYAMFPNLRERAASQGTRLSGGEQQMLAVGRILRTGARLLLLDEISEGLAPVIVQALGEGDPRAARAGLHDRDGRTELPLRRTAGRPFLRDGAWPHRPAVRSAPSWPPTWRCCTSTSACDRPFPNHGVTYETQDSRRLPSRWRSVRRSAPARRTRPTRSSSATSTTCRACMPTSSAPAAWRRPRWRSPISAARCSASRSSSSPPTTRTSPTSARRSSASGPTRTGST